MVRQILIPAAGRGARLDRPDTVKPLVDVGGVPLLERLLRQCQDAGIERAVVVVGYEARTIIRAMTFHPALELELVFVEHPRWEEGQASSLLAGVAALEDSPFLIAMADHYYDDGLWRQIGAANRPVAGVAALVEARRSQVFDWANAVKVRLLGEQVSEIGRALRSADGVDAGLFLCGPELIDELRRSYADDSAAELTDALQRLARAGRLRAVIARDGSYDDIDTPASLIHAEMRVRRERRERKLADARRQRHPIEASYEFRTGKPTRTEIIVGRGLVARAETLALIPDESASSPHFVFTDQTVYRLYGESFVGGLRRAGYDVHAIVIADGEESKTLANYVHLVERVLGRGIDERSIMISIGGGAVCNVCGLIASTLYRGIGLIHLPTTLMAQCDAAISHKQGVNGARGKNLVGSYYAPSRIVVDIDVLQTLDDWLIYDGLAEVLKHALGQDRGYAELLMAYDGDPRDPDFLEMVVRRNIELKCRLMADDPKEHRQGMVLQYGHTVGHPVEYQSGYELYHGQAVAIGMMVAARVARILGACDDELVELHRRLITKYRLPLAIPKGISPDDILDTMAYNKRYLMEGHRLALLCELGRLWQVDGDYAIPVPETVIRQAIEQSYEVAR
ncbi:MAG: iron-containing alcohol dehydrogenase [Myxococcales bacterium]|nr:iron-containing alcohol dehydrogenase [Myxococcales bacterium]